MIQIIWSKFKKHFPVGLKYLPCLCSNTVLRWQLGGEHEPHGEWPGWRSEPEWGGGVLSRFSYWDFQETDLGEKDVLLTFKLVSCQNVNVLIHSSAQFTVLSLWGGWGSGGQGLANRRVQGTMESGRGGGRPRAWKETSGGGEWV